MTTCWTTGVQFPPGQGFSLCHNVQTRSGAPTASCPVGKGAPSSTVEGPRHGVLNMHTKMGVIDRTGFSETKSFYNFFCEIRLKITLFTFK